jgi:hypothetical protein
VKAMQEEAHLVRTCACVATTSVPNKCSLPLTVMSEQPTQPGSPASDAKGANRVRFELELEFVQSLANPFYLHSLAQQNILNQPAFINFLKYLLYWKQKDYARFLQCDQSSL